MDTTKKRKKKITKVEKNPQQKTKKPTQNRRPLPLTGEDAIGGEKDGK